MDLSPNFTLAELSFSATATRKKLDNTPSDKNTANLILLCTGLLQPIRDIVAKPITVNSGYRSPSVNLAVGGSVTSAHRFGYAADINCYAYGSSKQFAEFIVKELRARNIKFDQIILEFNQWVHVAIYNQQKQQRGQVLTARTMPNGRTEYLSGLV